MRLQGALALAFAVGMTAVTAHAGATFDAVKAKGVFASGGNDAVAKVARGEAEIAVVLVSEIHDKGAKLAALLPEIAPHQPRPLAGRRQRVAELGAVDEFLHVAQALGPAVKLLAGQRAAAHRASPKAAPVATIATRANSGRRRFIGASHTRRPGCRAP